jgi:hypothetical protein
MDTLFYKIIGLLQNRTVLCPTGKKDSLDGFLKSLKTAANMVSWLPDIPRNAARSSSEA